MLLCFIVEIIWVVKLFILLFNVIKIKFCFLIVWFSWLLLVIFFVIVVLWLIINFNWFVWCEYKVNCMFVFVNNILCVVLLIDLVVLIIKFFFIYFMFFVC